MQLHIRRGSHRCDHLFRSHTQFTLRVIALVDDGEREVLCRAGWWQENIYQSQRLLDRLDARDAIRAEPIDTSEVKLFDPLPLSLITSAAWKHIRLAAANRAVARGHHITVADLIDGVHLESDDLKELGETERLIVEACTNLDRWLAIGADYNDQARIITLPSTQAKLTRMSSRP